MLKLETTRLIIEEAGINDINGIMEIEYHEAIKEYIWVSSYADHVDEINDFTTFLLKVVSKDTKQIIGFVILKYFEDNNSYKLKRVALLNSGKGYGEELINEIFNYCFKKDGLKEIWLEVYEDNLRAIRLYKKLGMVKVAKSKYDLESKESNIVVYSIKNKQINKWKQFYK